MTSSRRSEPLNVTDARMLHTGRSVQRLADALAPSIFQVAFSDLDAEDQAGVLMVAARAFEGVGEQGWDFVFRPDGSYGYVVA